MYDCCENDVRCENVLAPEKTIHCTLSEFLNNFTLPNYLCRLWVNLNSHCKQAVQLGGKETFMNWEINSDHYYPVQQYAQCEVLGVCDILCETSMEAINIVIKV